MPRTDQELAENIRRAAASLNAAIDEALSAGRNVEASWKSQNWGRVTRFDVDSIRVGSVAHVTMRRGKLVRVDVR